MKNIQVAITDYEDGFGNRIITNGFSAPQAKVTFRGSNNLLELEEGAFFSNLNVDFNASNGIFRMGKILKNGDSVQTSELAISHRFSLGRE